MELVDYELVISPERESKWGNLLFAGNNLTNRQY